MKFLAILLLILCQFLVCNKDFVVIEATSQKWAGGTPDSGTGTNYVIKIVPKTSNEKLNIDALWIGEDYYKIQTFKQIKNKRDTSFVKNDTVFIKAKKIIHTEKGRVLETTKKASLQPPYKFDSEALIGYTINGKRKYKEIKSLKKLDFIAYP